MERNYDGQFMKKVVCHGVLFQDLATLPRDTEDQHLRKQCLPKVLQNLTKGLSKTTMMTQYLGVT